MVALLAAAFTFVALTLLAMGIMQRTRRPADTRMQSLAKPAGAHRAASLSLSRRVVVPAVEAIGSAFASLLPAAFLRRTERRLVLAGQPLGASTLYTLVTLSGMCFGGLYFLTLFGATSGRPGLMPVLAGIMIAILGLYLPLFWLSNRAKARQSAMLRSLPDTLDLLTLCVEAGLGLEGALHRVVEKQSGPLADEIRQTLREVGLGKARRDALLDLAERTQLDDIRALATALVQAEQLGTSSAKVLRVQAQRMRVRRRQRAEQDARKASVRMVFPLTICLMPSLFIFILGPIFVSVYDFLSSS